MKAALLGMEYELPLSGPTDFLYVEDAAHAFITCADEITEGAHVFNIAGVSTTIEACIELIDDALPENRRGLLSCNGPEIPIAPCLDDSALRSATSYSHHTSLPQGILQTIARFQSLIKEGSLDRSDLPERTEGVNT
jgi:nucleoside-diphosphate-sugar epimerase